MLLLNREYSDGDLSAATSADLRNIGKDAWPRVLAHCHAPELRLYHVTLETLDGIDTLSATERLTVEWANKIERLDPVFRMTNLRRLWVFDLPRLRQIEGVERLSRLTELQLSGSRGALTPMLHLDSIKPVARIANLESFSLVNAKLVDDDITPLAECRSLRRLLLSNQFDRAQFAFLAKRLNNQLEQPIQPCVELKIECRKCGSGRFMFTGRRMPILCKKCDAQRFDKACEKFATLVCDAG